MANFNLETQQQIKETLQLLKLVFDSTLSAVYLYGSSIVGGLQKYSDLDLLVVTDKASTADQKAQLIRHLLHISGIYMTGSKLPIELTIVVQSAVNPWQYPPPFDFQYGEWLRNEFENGSIELWETKEMPDLALLVTQVLLASQTLYGPNPQQLLSEVPYKDFIAAQVQSLDGLIAELDSDTRNVLLTLTRIWSTVETDNIYSKPAAADWVMTRLPVILLPVIRRAKDICTGNETEHWDDIHSLVQPCAEYIVEQINQRIGLIHKSDSQNRIITLA